MLRATVFSLEVPADFVLARDACSYGYFLLAPSRWEPDSWTLTQSLDLGDSGGPAVCVRISQAGPRGAAHTRSMPRLRGRPLRVVCDVALSPRARAAAIAQITRILRLDEGRDVARAFHRVDPRWKRAGHCRLCRSATLFEDIIKTVTSCNVTWTGTVRMNRRLCETLGRRTASGTFAFPTPAALARQRPAFLRGRCGVGYRDKRIVEIARLFARDKAGQAQLEDPATTDAQVHERLLELPGIGPYAAANIMQLLGRYGHLPLDSESVRHGRTVLGFKGSAARVMKQVGRHFAPFGQHMFRAYWFELHEFYRTKAGEAHTWDSQKTERTFTAANLAG
ncbi:MAG: hypothetical protein ACKVS8_05185 [Phycisphaerales bacterium]